MRPFYNSSSRRADGVLLPREVSTPQMPTLRDRPHERPRSAFGSAHTTPTALKDRSAPSERCSEAFLRTGAKAA